MKISDVNTLLLSSMLIGGCFSYALPTASMGAAFFLYYILISLRLKITLNILLVVVNLVLVVFVNISSLLYALSIISCSLYLRKGVVKFPINIKLIRLIALLMAVIVMIQMIVTGDRTMITYEQNFTALYLFYLGLISVEWAKYFCFFLGMLTLSRGFFVSAIVYFLFSSSSRYFKRFTTATIWKIFLVILPLGFILLFFVSPHLSPSGYTSSAARLFNFMDTSALSRFDLIKPAIDYFQQYWLFGYPADLYAVSLFGGKSIVHNNIVQLFILYGVPFTIIYFISLAGCFSFHRETRAIFLSLCLWGLTLHSVINPQFLFILLCINTQINLSASNNATSYK